MITDHYRWKGSYFCDWIASQNQTSCFLAGFVLPAHVWFHVFAHLGADVL